VSYQGDFTAYRKEIRDFIDNVLEPYAADIDRNDKIPPEVWQMLKDKRLFSLTLPREPYGGMGLSLTEYYQILEDLSRTAGYARVIVHQINGLSYFMIQGFGSKEQKEYYLSRMGKGDMLLAFGLTEPDRGTGADIGTTAVKKGDKWVLNGKKHLITIADLADATVIFAVTDEAKRKKGGITAFLVEPNTPGLSMVNLPVCMGSRGLYEGLLTFTDCAVPESSVLGEVGQGLDIALHVLDESRASLAVSSLGLAEKFLELAVARAKSRVTFGKPIAQRQAIQQMIADMATDIHALRLMVYDMTAKFDAGLSVRMEASFCKLFGITALKTVSDNALEIYGGIGYSSAHPIERMYRDTRSIWLEEGTPTIQRLVIARDVLNKY